MFFVQIHQIVQLSGNIAPCLFYWVLIVPW